MADLPVRPADLASLAALFFGPRQAGRSIPWLRPLACGAADRAAA